MSLLRWAPVPLVLLQLACGGAPQATEGPRAGEAPPQENLPNIPAVVDAVRVAPMVGHQPAAASPLLGIMQTELDRWTKKLSAMPVPAHFVAYTITEQRVVVIEAEGGGLINDADQTIRTLDVEVRAGSPEFDNRRMLANDRLRVFTFMPRRGKVPFGEDEKAIRSALWLESDRRYREALLNLRNLTTLKGMSASEERAPDFSVEEKREFIQPVVQVEVDKKALQERMRQCSKRARRGVATRSGCRADLTVTTRYYVNSEGSRIQTSAPKAHLSVSVGIKADDGMPLSRTEDRFVRDLKDLPGPAEVTKMINRVSDDLDDLHAAPVVDPYVGPAILEGRAAAVFFHEVFGHRIEGHRQKDPSFGKTFTNQVGKRIMPSWLSVYDDPTISELNEMQLNGFYRFDDEGIDARNTPLVKEGVLKGFVLGRTPLERYPKSNGHGRRAPGLPAVSRQGNLVVEATHSVDNEELRARLLEEVKRQGKPYGMIFTDISGGYTNTSQGDFLQSFKVLPTMAYRLYPDGHTELVRGVDIIGTPLTVLASIRAAARPLQIFNGMCGAESGWVPVSASAPGLLLETVEVERSFKPGNKPPVLNPPSTGRSAK